MSVTLNTLAYVQDSFQTPNRVAYAGPSQTFEKKDNLILARTAPKPSGTYRGMARAQVKRVKTVTLDDSSKADIIMTVDIAIPVGAAAADIDAVRDDVGDFLIGSEAGTLIKNHDLTY